MNFVKEVHARFFVGKPCNFFTFTTLYILLRNPKKLLRRFYKKDLFLFCCFLLAWVNAGAQSIVFSENFESGNAFTVVNGSQANQWVVGAAAANGGTQAAYISNNSGTSNAYTPTASSTVFMYCDVTFPASNVPYKLTFYWRCEENSTDVKFEVYLKETTTTPVAGSSYSVSDDNLVGTFRGSSAWRQAAIGIPQSCSGTTKRLVFCWSNTSGDPLKSPVAVDNIELTTVMPLSEEVMCMAGGLQAALMPAEKSKLTNLTVAGAIDARDVAFMRDSLPLLMELDLSGVTTIAAYSGLGGTIGNTSYPAGGLPEHSFYNLNTLIPKHTLASVLLPTSGLTSIGNNAFRNCRGISGSLTLPVGLKSIGDAAFYSCSGFDGTLTLPDGLTSIGDFAFDGCSNFRGSLVLPTGLESIGDYAFSSCKGFNGNLVLPDGLESIGSSAFYSCSGFTGSLALPDGLTNLGSFAFSYCSGFNGSLTLPATGLTSIESSVFFYCGFTGSLTIPEGITSVGSSAFGLCDYFNGTLTLPTSLTDIGSSAFSFCGFTDSLTLPVGLTSIGDGAFSNCQDFTGNLVLPEGLTSLSEGVFYYCDGFSSLTLPSSLTSIGESAFAFCNGLTEITNHNPTPPSIYYADILDNVFLGVNQGDIWLFLDTKEAYDLYKAADVWKDFRFPSNDTLLISLEVDSGSLVPAFSSTTFDYTVSVGYDTTSIRIMAIARHAGATVSGDTGRHALNVGDNIFHILVTAEDGVSMATYTVLVTRAAPLLPPPPPPLSNDTLLISLAVDSGRLAPLFSSTTFNYTVSVGYDTTSITIIAIARHAGATVSGATGRHALNVGDNIFRILVTAENGISTATYTVVVTRDTAPAVVVPPPPPPPLFLSSDSVLLDLEVSVGELTPAFVPDIISYNFLLSCSEDSLHFRATPPTGGSVRYLVGSTEVSSPLGMSAGEHVVLIIRSVAEDGVSILDYTIEVTRPFPSSAIRRYWDDVLAIDHSAVGGRENILAYQWFKNGKVIPDASLPYLYFETNRPQPLERYGAELTIGGRRLPVCEVVIPNNEPVVSALKAYPNPVSHGKLNVEGSELSEGEMVELYSLSGTWVTSCRASGGRAELSVSGLPVGTYVLRAGSTAITILIVGR